MDRPAIGDEDLRWLLELLDKEQLTEVEIHLQGQEVLVSRSSTQEAAATPLAVPPPPGADPAPPSEGLSLPENHLPVLSPMAGVFYRSSAPDAPPLVEPGDHLEFGDTIGLVEAMKLFNEIPAPAAGTIIRFLVENEQQVEADQPLMVLEVHSAH